MSDDKIAEIRARHEQVPSGNLSIAAISLAHDDRATLLAEVDRLRADLATQQGCCDGAAAQDAHIRREREEYRAEVERLRAENERLLQAIGLVTTTVPEMEIDIENPVGMAQRVVAEFERLRADNERLRAELDVELLRLAACNVVAMADTPESAIEARKMKPEYRSATLSRVERRVDEVIALRAENERLREELRWYADQRNYFPVERRSPGDPDPAVVFVDEPAIMTDWGRRARKALEGKP